MRKIVLILLLSSVASAQCPTSSLFFANGMQNTTEDARRSLNALKDRIAETEGWHRDDSYLLFNPNAELLSQVLDAYTQKMTESTIDFWRWVGDLGLAPTWFQEAVRKFVVVYELQQRNGVDLSGFYSVLTRELDHVAPLSWWVIRREIFSQTELSKCSIYSPTRSARKSE